MCSQMHLRAASGHLGPAPWPSCERDTPERGQMSYTVLPNWLTSYRKNWLRPDVIAGVTTAAVIIPKAMAYATIAGLPVQVGLYTAFLPMVIYAVLGTSRALSVSTTTTIAILAAAELGEVVPGADAPTLLAASATLTLIVGAMLVLASILRLGFVANFISEPVLIGFKAGIGLVIVLDMLPKIFGIHFAKSGFFRTQISLVRHLPDTSLITLAVGIAMIVVLVGIEHFAPKLPAPLFAVGLGITGAYLLNLHAHGVELVGHIPQGLPSPHRTRSFAGRTTLAWRSGHCPDELHRDHRCWSRIRAKR